MLNTDYSLAYKIKKIAAATGIVAIFLFITFVIGCPFYFITHIICPGCGTSRAFLAFFRLDFKSAFMYHPLFPLVIIAAIILVSGIIIYMKKEHKNFFSFSSRDLDIVCSQIMSHTSAKVFLIIFIALYAFVYIGRIIGFIPYIPMH